MDLESVFKLAREYGASSVKVNGDSVEVTFFQTHAAAAKDPKDEKKEAKPRNMIDAALDFSR
jgi:hypothetical protein